MSAPAGWHRQDDGRERFWDGQQWTDQFRQPELSDATSLASPLASPLATPVEVKPSAGKKFRPWMGYVGSGLVGALLGAAVGSGGDTPKTPDAAKPTPTVTVTTQASQGSSPSDTPGPAAAVNTQPKTKEFKVGIKILEKTCFGSAGCNVTYRIAPEYVGETPLPDGGTIEVTYEVKGLDDSSINTFTIEGGTASFDEKEIGSTPTTNGKLSAVVTNATYRE